MPLPTQFRSVLLGFAGLLLISSLGVWLATGRHLGWTKTEVTRIERDEITGLDYPIREDKLVAGIDMLGLGLGLAGSFALASRALRPRDGKSQPPIPVSSSK